MKMVVSTGIGPCGINSMWVVVMGIDIEVGAILVVEIRIKTRMETGVAMLELTCISVGCGMEVNAIMVFMVVYH